MSNEDPTKELPGAPDTEPTMYTVLERLNGLAERLTAMQESADRRHAETQERFNGLDERLTNMDERLTETQELADRRYAETQERFNGLDERLTNMDERLTNMDERLTNMDERLTNMDERLTNMDERLTNTQESADLRHVETNANFRKLGDKMDILNLRMLDSEANQVDLRRRIEKLETQAS